jgi:hypothetical protein
LPPDLKDWVPDDDLAHFIIAAVERVPHRDENPPGASPA